MISLQYDYILKHNSRVWKILPACIQLLKKTNSTHQLLLQYLDNDKLNVDNYLFISNTQTAGVGRQNTDWYDEPNRSILLSFYQKKRYISPVLTLLTAILLCKNLNKKRTHPIQIKWPNDLYLNGKKLAGLLTQKYCDGIIISIGFNYALKNKKWSSWVDNQVSVQNSTKLLIHIVDAIFQVAKTDQTQLNSDDVKYFNAMHFLQNANVNFEYNGQYKQGDVVSIEKDGGLQINSGDTKQTIYSGDVSRIRPVLEKRVNT